MSVRGDLAAVLNIAVFVPVGWLAYYAGRRLGLRPPGRGLLVVLVGLGLSLMIEVGQYVVANRHGLRWSFITRHGGDVALHLSGAVAGALVAGNRARHR